MSAYHQGLPYESMAGRVEDFFFDEPKIDQLPPENKEEVTTALARFGRALYDAADFSRDAASERQEVRLAQDAARVALRTLRQYGIETGLIEQFEQDLYNRYTALLPPPSSGQDFTL